jgi:DNA-binding transcriptional LysR family regulator
MENRHMRYFLAVADLGSLTKAAEYLDVSQPALTQVINKLERDLGVQLLVRSRAGADLTAAGLAIIDDMRESLARADAAALRAKAVAAGLAGRLTIGFVTLATHTVLPRALHAFRAKRPGVEIVLREMGNLSQAQALAHGIIDIALLHTPVSLTGRMREKVVSREPMVAVVPAGSSIGSDGRVSLAEIARAGLIWFPERNLPFLRMRILAAMRRAGGEGRVVQEVERSTTALACVAAGLGVCLLPASVRHFLHQDVRVLDISDGEDLPRFEIRMAWAPQLRPSLAAEFAMLLDPV